MSETDAQRTGREGGDGEKSDARALAPTETAGGDAQRARAIELLHTFDVGMVTTQREDGSLAARPMYLARIDEDGVFWLITRADAGLSAEVDARPQVCVTLRGGGRFMSVTAHARIVDDPEKLRTLWKDGLRIWFPQGLMRGDAVVIRLRPVEAEFWDRTSTRGVLFAIRAARAIVRGEREANLPATHARVRLGPS